MHAVVLLHAFPLDRRMWRAQLATLEAEGVRAFAPDLRGFGAASAAPYPTSLDEHADDVAALLDRHGEHLAHVVGLSMGGYVALAFAKKHASRLAGLVLADTRASADSPAARLARDTNIAKVRAEGTSALVEGMLPKLLSPRAHASVIAEVRAIASEQPIEGLAAALAAMRDREDLTHVAEQLRLPTTIVVGAEDVITPKDEAQALAHRMKDARYVELVGAGHLSNLEQSHAFSSAILDHVHT